jgi:hypothetical protein
MAVGEQDLRHDATATSEYQASQATDSTSDDNEGYGEKIDTITSMRSFPLAVIPLLLGRMRLSKILI